MVSLMTVNYDLFQNLLANPDLNKPVNPEAAEMIMRSPHAYRQMVLDCVAASQRVEGSYQGIDPAKYSKIKIFFYCQNIGTSKY